MFYEILVIDYITDFKSLTPDDLQRVSNFLSGRQFLENCPPGTIIGIPIDGEKTNQRKVFYPMLSHISLPIKAGERVWAFDQSPQLVSYWISRKVQNIAAEDLNFTHDDRARLYPTISKDPELLSKNSEIFYDANMTVVSLKETRNNAISRKEFVGEPVASIKNKSTDLTLQGSNGTLINLTNLTEAQTGTIDLIAGLSDIDNKKKIRNSENYEELIKPAGLIDPSPGDKSRVIISQKFNSDKYYQLPDGDSGDVPTISLKTDSVRIIAKNDLKIIVGNSDDPSSIIMKNNGDIIITPSSLGVIKLGGEDATGAILATEDSIVQAGRVIAPSIVSTAGGIIGASEIPGTGLFSTKVLVKVR